MGSALGAEKSAATKTGCSHSEWLERRAGGQRWCYRCRAWKLLDVFHRDGNRHSGRASICKPCLSIASTASRYRMSRAQLAAFKAERDSCEICGSADKLVIDHNHKTGWVRGILCPNCNSAIGKLREEPALFQAALAYLEKSNGG